MKWIFLVLTFCCPTLFAQDKAEFLKIVNPDSNWYEVLGINSDASPAEIKSAHRRLLWIYHPDKQKNPANHTAANAALKRINEAREVLSDSLKRKSYDITIKATSTVKAAGKTASSPNDAWKKYSFTEFTEAKPEKPAEKPTEKPKADAKPNNKPEPKANAEAKPEPVNKPQPTEVQARNSSPASMKAKQAMKMYGENSKCGLGYFQPLIDIKQ